MSGETGPAPEEPKPKETTEKRRVREKAEKPRTREEVESAFYDCFGLLEHTDDSKLSSELAWAKKTIRQSIDKSLDRGRDTIRVDFNSEHTKFAEEEGIPVDYLLDFMKDKIFEGKFDTAERRSWEEKYRVLKENSIDYDDVDISRTDPEQWTARVRYEANLISNDSRATGDPLKDWNLAKEEIKKRKELFVTPRAVARAAVTEAPAVTATTEAATGEPTSEPKKETEFIGPPPPPPWAREFATVLGNRSDEIRNNALLERYQKIREEMRRGSLWDPRTWTRKIGLRLGEDYFGAKYLAKAIDAKLKSLNTNAQASFEGSAVDEIFEKAEETQAGKEGIQRAKEGKLIEGEKVTEAAGELKKKIVDGLLRPIVEGGITDEKQLQAKIKEFIDANKDNAEIKAIFGPEASKYGNWADYFASDLLEMGASVKETMETHKKTLAELDDYIKIKLANISWTAEKGAPDPGAIDKLVMKMQGGEKRRWILNPAALGFGAAVGTAVGLRTIGVTAQASQFIVPGVGAAVGGAVAGLRRYHDMNVDRATAQIEDTYSQWPEGNAPRRESLAERDYDRAHVGELLNGGGIDLITGEERKSLSEVLSRDLSEGQETNRQDVIRRIAEITKRLDFSRKNGLDLVRYEGATKVQHGRLDMLTAVETAKEKLRASGMNEEQIKEAENKLRGDWEEKFIQDTNEQDRAFAGYRLRNAIGSAVFGGAAGLGAGLLAQEAVALGGRALGQNVGETGLEFVKRNLSELGKPSVASAAEITAPVANQDISRLPSSPSGVDQETGQATAAGISTPSETTESTIETAIRDEQKPVFGPDGEWTKNSTRIDLREWYAYDQSGSQGNELKLHTLKQGDSLILDLSSMQEAHQKGLSPNPIDVQSAIKSGETGFYISMGNGQNEGIWVHDSADGKIDGKVALNLNDTQNLIHTASGNITNAELARMVINQDAFQKLPDGNIATEVNGRQEIFKLNHGGKPGFIEAGRLIDQNGAKGLQTFATIQGSGIASETVSVPVEVPVEPPKPPGEIGKPPETPPPGETGKPDETPKPKETFPGYPFGTESPRPTPEASPAPAESPAPAPTGSPEPTRTPAPGEPSPRTEGEQLEAPSVIPIPFAPRHPLEPIPGKAEERVTAEVARETAPKKGLGSKVFDASKKVGTGIAGVAKKTGKEAGKGTVEIAKGVGKLGRKAGAGIGEGAKKVGKGAAAGTIEVGRKAAGVTREKAGKAGTATIESGKKAGETVKGAAAAVPLWVRRRFAKATPAATAGAPAEPAPAEIEGEEAPPAIPAEPTPPTKPLTTIEAGVELPPTHPAAEDTGADLEVPVEPEAVTQDELAAAAREITEQARAESEKEVPEPISPAEPVEPTVEAKLFAPSGDIFEDMKRISNMTPEELKLEGEKRAGKFREKVIVDGVERPILSDLKLLMAQEAAAFAQGKTLEETAKPEKIEQVVEESGEDQEARRNLAKLLHGQADTNMRIEQVRARLKQLMKKPEEEKLESKAEAPKKEEKIKRKGLFGRKKSGKEETEVPENETSEEKARRIHLDAQTRKERVEQQKKEKMDKAEATVAMEAVKKKKPGRREAIKTRAFERVKTLGKKLAEHAQLRANQEAGRKRQPKVAKELRTVVPTEPEISKIAGVGFAEDSNIAFRHSMEDAHTIVENFGGKENQSFFGIFDGHGGKEVADFVSKRLHENILSLLNSGLKPRETLRQAYLTTDNQATRELTGDSGSTAVSALVIGDKLYIANAGDARAVLSRKGVAIRLSKDHTADEADEKKRVKKAGGRVIGSRVEGVLAVARSFGDKSLKSYVIADPHLAETVLKPEDNFLILACDGVWDVLKDQEAVNLIKDEQDPKEAANRLKTEALQKGSQDNISVLVVKLRLNK